MKDIFDYCFYRIALFYKKRLPLENHIRQGHSVLIITLSFYLLSITELVLFFFFNLNITKAIAIVILVPSCLILFFIEKAFPNSELLYKEKVEQYRNEKFKWIKGFLVFLFVFLSFFSMFAVYFVVHNKLLT
jgi:membrane protease YdiL (CAAX protease family)